MRLHQLLPRACRANLERVFLGRTTPPSLSTFHRSLHDGLRTENLDGSTALKGVPPSQSSWREDSPTHVPHGDVLPPEETDPPKPQWTRVKISLPVSCPGCGALSQEVEASEPGFYRRSRKHVREYLKSKRATLPTPAHSSTTLIPEPDEADPESAETSSAVASKAANVPVCDRCHDLIYDYRGVSIAHPSLEEIADSIAESPFRRNHVYHILDAADFPMSLEPKILSQLSLARPRSRNRRSQQSYPHKPTLSFIITRSDLLAPTKEKVDSLMPYFQSLLRTALGRKGETIRLGNVHMVSAKRGWWTTDIKEDIWKRGGGNWMVGKFNVGKSNLFEVLFPKGSGERAPSYAELAKQQAESSRLSEPDFLPESSLLPPPQPEMPFPTMPIVSNLPGTTASPIRLPFGNNKGELIDMPGLERSDLDEFVQQDHKPDLVMTSRPKVSQHTIKPGQSLLLGGGLVRITPNLDANDPSTTLQAFPFVPLDAHVTATDKAVGTQEQLRESGIKTILAENVGATFRSAGTIALDHDVTKRHAGPLLRANVPIDNLPFRIYSTDLLIQGVGWVELVCQVRRRSRPVPVLTPQPSVQDDQDQCNPDTENKNPGETSFKPFAQSLDSTSTLAPTALTPEVPIFPTVEVFTPHGKHISHRPPLGAWILWKEGGGKLKSPATLRPRRSMKGLKKTEKGRARE